MSNLLHKDSHPLITSSLNLSNAENVNIGVKHGHYEHFYPQQSLSDNIHFQIYYNEGYFMDMSSTFIDLNVTVEKSDNAMPIRADGISYENCILHNLFRQISVYINSTLVSTSKNLSNCTSYMQFILMIPKSYKELRGISNGYEYITHTESTDALKNATTS